MDLCGGGCGWYSAAAGAEPGATDLWRPTLHGPFIARHNCDHCGVITVKLGNEGSMGCKVAPDGPRRRRLWPVQRRQKGLAGRQDPRRPQRGLDRGVTAQGADRRVREPRVEPRMSQHNHTVTLDSCFYIHMTNAWCT